MPTTSITSAPLPIPETLNGSAGAGFTASVELANLVTCLIWGHNDFWVSPAARLPIPADPGRLADQSAAAAAKAGGGARP
jgi:hypothetical protein